MWVVAHVAEEALVLSSHNLSNFQVVQEADMVLTVAVALMATRALHQELLQELALPSSKFLLAGMHLMSVAVLSQEQANCQMVNQIDVVMGLALAQEMVLSNNQLLQLVAVHLMAAAVVHLSWNLLYSKVVKLVDGVLASVPELAGVMLLWKVAVGAGRAVDWAGAVKQAVD